MAKIALVKVSIPCLLASFVDGRPRPAKELLRYQASRILGPHNSVHRVAVEVPCLGTGTALVMSSDSRRRGEGLPAQRAGECLSSMDPRLQVLGGGIGRQQSLHS